MMCVCAATGPSRLRGRRLMCFRFPLSWSACNSCHPAGAAPSASDASWSRRTALWWEQVRERQHSGEKVFTALVAACDFSSLLQRDACASGEARHRFSAKRPYWCAFWKKAFHIQQWRLSDRSAAGSYVTWPLRAASMPLAVSRCGSTSREGNHRMTGPTDSRRSEQPLSASSPLNSKATDLETYRTSAAGAPLVQCRLRGGERW